MSNKKNTLYPGKLFVISGPSGVGKTTICKTLCATIPHLLWSVSATTRPKREGEISGQDYHFLTLEEFKTKITNHEFLEYAEVHNHFYGTLKAPIINALSIGHHYLLEIDVQGAYNVKQVYPQSILIFIAPPSFETLRQRLIDRNLDSLDVIERRIQNAKKELASATFYDHQVCNATLEECIMQITTIMHHAILACQ